MTFAPACHRPRAVVAVLMVLFGLLFAPRMAWAHNSFESSTPADGAVLDVAPTEMVLVFAKAVPLDTVTVQLVDPTGARTDLTGLANGPNGEQEVVVPLPALTGGDYSVRWRLVGSDGHAITGRVAFTAPVPVAPAPVTQPPVVDAPVTQPPAVVPAPTQPGVTQPLVTQPVLTQPIVVDAAAPSTAVESPAAPDAEAEVSSTASPVRWLLRMIAYGAIAMIAGVAAMAVIIWPGVWNDGGIRRAVAWAVGASMVAALGQWLIIAGDITGRSPLASLGKLSGALHTDAGLAMLIRLVLCVALVALIFGARELDDEHRWVGASALVLAMLATWAFAGHSASQRWSLIGVPLDVGHHAAAAGWLGCLAVMAFFVARVLDGDALAAVVNRFAWFAGRAVLIIVVTGVLQAIRLVGGPGGLFTTTHGRLLLAKLVVVGLMLKVADVNRKRVTRRFVAGKVGPRTVEALRRAMATELVVGALVIGLTAALVVSQPASATDESASAPVVATTQPVITTPPTTVAPTTTLLTCTISATLRMGDTGEAVSCLQAALIRDGFLTATTTGTFDLPTDAAVKALQTARALTVDGIVGPQTGKALGIWADA